MWFVKDQMAANTCGGSLLRAMERGKDTPHKQADALLVIVGQNLGQLYCRAYYETVLFLHFYIIFPKLVRKPMISNFTL